MKRKVYLFNQTGIAANYGIGTYIDQIICFAKNRDIELTLIELSIETKEVVFVHEKELNKIKIPYKFSVYARDVKKDSSHYQIRYIRNVVYLLIVSYCN
jgi:hypothetical protein